MSFISKIPHKNTLKFEHVVLGMVMDIKVVTNINGYDFKILVHRLTKEEEVVSKHEVVVPGNGSSLIDIKQEIHGKYILTAMDSNGYGLSPLRGRLFWSTERHVYISPLNDFEVNFKPKNGTSQSVGVFNVIHRRKFTLPMPPNGWNCKVLDFVEKDGTRHRFLFDGVKE